MQFDNLTKTLTVSESKITNLTGENLELKAETKHLTDHIRNTEATWNKNNISRAQWSVDAYCPKKTVSGRKCSACQDGWLPSQSSCYLIKNPSSDGQKTWEEAQADCGEKNSYLVVVADETEKQFISENSWRSSDNKGYWIGLRAENNKWMWVDGSDLTNNIWIQESAQDGHCAISVQNQGWKSVMCNVKQQWICEKMALTI
ncbi:C-type lectin domain family 4 member M [Austrofundulus limnaeus]|uniref:C-type lectin domain family 4 member M n=1 Tax=Austrofundulus limnaeus TaxID=52670 RepID=A0A2I4D5W0_AUSLI|nr:PREDICTED: C-type lectin domain family 4 member M-like [Austrofundulus limnaeus]